MSRRRRGIGGSVHAAGVQVLECVYTLSAKRATLQNLQGGQRGHNSLGLIYMCVYLRPTPYGATHQQRCHDHTSMAHSLNSSAQHGDRLVQLWGGATQRA